jgi:hypothetical protein
VKGLLICWAVGGSLRGAGGDRCKGGNCHIVSTIRTDPTGLLGSRRALLLFVPAPNALKGLHSLTCVTCAERGMFDVTLPGYYSTLK